MTHENGTSGDDTPDRYVTINQIIAWNIAWYRRAAGITQKELGERIGWSNASVSEAERSWDGKRTREFDAHTITSLSIALGVPILALFLPPEDDGVHEHYVFGAAGEEATMTGLMRCVVPDTGDDTPAMDAYRKRLEGAVTYYADPEFGAQVARFLREATNDELRADRAARIRQRQAELTAIHAELDDIATALENPEAGQ